MVTDTALDWFRSYLTARTHRIKIENSTSAEIPLLHCVPQGSVLGLVLLSVYTQPFQVIFKRHQVHYHKYADDTTIYVFSTLQSQES